MKTIVIHPELIGYDNTGLHEPRRPLNRNLVAFALLVPVVAFGGWFSGRLVNRPEAPLTPMTLALPAEITPSFRAEPGAVQITAPAAETIDLQTALEQGIVRAEFSGNGRETLTAKVFNTGAEPLRVKVSFGQMLESGRNAVVVVRDAWAEIAPNAQGTLKLNTAATRSNNRHGNAAYRLSYQTTPKLDLLLTHVQEHPEISVATVQVAILALTENLPLSAVCKFTPSGSDIPSRFDTDAFRAETLDIINALALLRGLGVKDRDIAMTVDPQLKVEAMIEPLCRAVAMRYFGISAANEWAYWKNELLQGEPGTRHYALFGIARYYPQTAIEMLPQWAREKRTTQTLRLAAIQALADTQRAEALPILRQLVEELGRNTELGRAALDAAKYLDRHLTSVASLQPTVAFRSATAPVRF